MKKTFILLAAYAATSTAAFAVALPGGTTTTPVPEISALEGVAAIAALAAVVMLVWERSRRAA